MSFDSRDREEFMRSWVAVAEQLWLMRSLAELDPRYLVAHFEQQLQQGAEGIATIQKVEDVLKDALHAVATIKECLNQCVELAKIEAHHKAALRDAAPAGNA